jgi:hypothetical protein
MPFELIPKMTDHSLYAHCVRKCSGNHVSNGFTEKKIFAEKISFATMKNSDQQ